MTDFTKVQKVVKAFPKIDLLQMILMTIEIEGKTNIIIIILILDNWYRSKVTHNLEAEIYFAGLLGVLEILSAKFKLMSLYLKIMMLASLGSNQHAAPIVVSNKLQDIIF